MQLYDFLIKFHEILLVRLSLTSRNQNFEFNLKIWAFVNQKIEFSFRNNAGSWLSHYILWFFFKYHNFRMRFKIIEKLKENSEFAGALFSELSWFVKMIGFRFLFITQQSLVTYSKTLGTSWRLASYGGHALHYKSICLAPSANGAFWKLRCGTKWSFEKSKDSHLPWIFRRLWSLPRSCRCWCFEERVLSGNVKRKRMRRRTRTIHDRDDAQRRMHTKKIARRKW